jgi:hypothetical protein
MVVLFCVVGPKPAIQARFARPYTFTFQALHFAAQRQFGKKRSPIKPALAYGMPRAMLWKHLVNKVAQVVRCGRFCVDFRDQADLDRLDDAGS